MRSRTCGFLLAATLGAACAPGAVDVEDGEEGAERPGQSADAGTSSEGGAIADSALPTADGAVSWVEDPLDEGSACAALSMAAEEVLVEEEVEVEVEVEVPAPVALYVMFDKSLSMSWSSLWTPAVSAFGDFVKDPDSAGMDIALQYFPSGGSCNGNGYSTPAVALGKLPGHQNSILNSLAAQTANGYGTPIEGALRGVTQYCESFQAAHPEQRCVAVLITDGKPEYDGCEHDETKLAAIAGNAWTQHQVRTFAVGLQGADFGLLDKIAKAGGASDCDPGSSRFACDVSQGADKLGDALASIRDTVTTTEVRTELQTRVTQRPLECEWAMPTPGEGMTVDRDRVNVTVSGGAAALSLGRVPDAAGCREGAWHFDSAENPSRIVACPESCAAIKAEGHTDVKILLGCATRVLLL